MPAIKHNDDDASNRAAALAILEAPENHLPVLQEWAREFLAKNHEPGGVVKKPHSAQGQLFETSKLGQVPVCSTGGV